MSKPFTIWISPPKFYVDNNDSFLRWKWRIMKQCKHDEDSYMAWGCTEGRLAWLKIIVVDPYGISGWSKEYNPS